MRLIARAEQNNLGLMVKLEKKGFDSAVVKAVVSTLTDRNLLNDERYAELWLRARLKKKPQSPKTLFFSLLKRGIDKCTSKKALEKVIDPDTEYTLLLKYTETLKNDMISEKRNFSLRAHLKHESFSPETLERYFDSL